MNNTHAPKKKNTLTVLVDEAKTANGCISNLIFRKRLHRIFFVQCTHEGRKLLSMRKKFQVLIKKYSLSGREATCFIVVVLL